LTRWKIISVVVCPLHQETSSRIFLLTTDMLPASSRRGRRVHDDDRTLLPPLREIHAQQTLEWPHANECEVCKLLIKGLQAYRDMVIPDMPLPTSISVKCAPGHSFYVQKAVKRTSNSSRISINATPRRNDSEVENLQKQDIVGFDGLEFFVVPGECVQSAIILC
jgi:hypothetical protein